MTDDERELRAFEAIIASQIHRDRDPMNLDDLPELTDAQRAKMDSLPADLIQRLWDTVVLDDDDCPPDDSCTADEEEEELVGMNRADDEQMDDETRQALNETRNEVIESMKRRRKEDGRANS